MELEASCLKWFRYRQNNSGGYFTEPARKVYIQAQDENDANDIAEENGLYFNGCESGSDCDCCGDRWGYPYDDEGGELVIAEGDLEDRSDGIPSVMIVPFNHEPIFPSSENIKELEKLPQITLE